MSAKIAKLPQLLSRKIYKTGQTRGADDDVIYQNRVARNSTVLIPYELWSDKFPFPEGGFENGYIVLISPEHYFETKAIEKKLHSKGLKLCINALIFYYSRKEWDKYNPETLKLKPAQNRTRRLGGSYVARVPATTALENGGKIMRGFTTTAIKGAGIRVFEYASSEVISNCRDQLEALFWLCRDSEAAVEENGMDQAELCRRKKEIMSKCSKKGLLDYKKLTRARVVDREHKTVCPLCLEQISGKGFFSRMKQAEGREVQDITVTEINLFHIEELRFGKYNHCPYNVGWGHHHCNVVTKDSGVINTLEWMARVLKRNDRLGYRNFEKRLP